METPTFTSWAGRCLASLLLFTGLNAFSQQTSTDIYLNELPHNFTSFFARKSVALPSNDPEGGRFIIASQVDLNHVAITKVDDQGAPVWVKMFTPPPGIHRFHVADFIRFEHKRKHYFALLTYTDQDLNTTDELWKPNLLLLHTDGTLLASHDFEIQDDEYASMRICIPKKIVWDEDEKKFVILASLSNNSMLAGHFGEDEEENLLMFTVNASGVVMETQRYDINGSYNTAIDLYLDEADPGYWVLTNERVPLGRWGVNAFKVDNSLGVLAPSSDINPSANFDLIRSNGWSCFEENNERYFAVYGQMRDYPNTIGNYDMFIYTFNLGDALNCQGSCFNSSIPNFHIPGTLEEYIADGMFLSTDNPTVAMNGVQVNYQTVGVNFYNPDFHPCVYYYKVTGNGSSIATGFDVNDVTGAFYDIEATEDPGQVGNLYVNRFITGISKQTPTGWIHNPLILHRPDAFQMVIDDACEFPAPPVRSVYTGDMGSSEVNAMSVSVSRLDFELDATDEDRDVKNLCQYPMLNQNKTGEASETAAAAEDLITLWPNPATAGGHVQLSLSSPSDIQLTLRMYDATGRQVYNNTVNVTGETPQKLEINTGNLHAGVYFLRAEQGNNLRWSDKLVIE